MACLEKFREERPLSAWQPWQGGPGQRGQPHRIPLRVRGRRSLFGPLMLHVSNR